MKKDEQPVRSPIITPGDPERWPLLEMASQTCSLPITHADEQAVIEMDALLEALDEDAAGLAAVQIGVPRRVFLLRNGHDTEGEGENRKEITWNNVYINPTILNKSRGTTRRSETCLSLPGMEASFHRPKSVTLQYFDLDGEAHQETFKGFWARAVMHEMDHLDGILITRHLEEQIAKQPRRTSFGMKSTPHREKVIATRRARKKRARASKKHARITGR